MAHSTYREISTGLKIKILLGGPLGVIGIAFLLMSLFFVAIFGSMVELNAGIPDDAPETKGHITDVQNTGAVVNGQDVYAFYFEFRHYNGETYQGVSYSSDRVLQSGDEVEVKYNAQEPVNSNIVGMRSSSMPTWVMLFFIPFLAVGFGLTGFKVYKGLKNIRILQNGRIAYGKLIDKEPTNTRINDQMVYKLTFEFEAYGRKYTATAKTHKPHLLEDELEEKLVFDPADPSQAVMIDELPKGVKRFFLSLEQ